LSNKGLAYNEVNIDTAPEREQEMTQYTMAQTVPLVVVQEVDNPQALPKMMQGFNMARLAEVVS
jgi:glutaredoxin